MPKKSYQYILFDWDGCLANTLGLWLKAYQTILPQYRIKMPNQDIIDRLFHDWTILPRLGITDNHEFGGKVYSYFATYMHQIKLHRQVFTTLTSLKKNKKQLAIITSSQRHVFLKILRHYRLHNHFKIAITYEDVTHIKPHPEPIEKAIQLLKAKKENTIMIGDSYADILAGKNAGITTVWYYPKENENFYRPNHFSHLMPDFTIHRLSELLQIVE